MEEMYGIGINSATSAVGDDYSDSNSRGLLMPEYYGTHYHYDNPPPMTIPADHHRRISPTPFDQSGLIHHCPPESASSAHRNYDVIKTKIGSHPSYPKLLSAYIDCQKVGAPPEIAFILEEIRREKDLLCKRDTLLGLDPELDDFMETYYDVLVKYKTDLSRTIDEAKSFLDNIETQLANLCKDDGALSSDEEFSGGETETQAKNEDRELKDQLLRRYGDRINSLKLEFSKKKKKGKLPKEARQMLLDWWNVHYKWPYPTEADKISLAETTGLDQKQINNWFINQRKRHWKPSENMHIAMMDNLSGNFYMDD